MKLGFIAVGRTAGRYAEVAKEDPDFQLTAVAEVDATKGKAFAEQHGAAAYTDYRELLGKADVDTVCIFLPHHLHAPAALDALAAGKHIFIEKPLAMNVAECDAIATAAQKAGKTVMVGHHRHFTGVALAARREVQAGAIGKPVFAVDQWHKGFFEFARPQWFLEKEKGGGMWPMNGSHMIDQLMFITGDRVAAVRAMVGSPIFGHRQTATDCAAVYLTFASGFVALIAHGGFKDGVYRAETEFVGTETMMRVGEKDVTLARQGQYVPVDVPQAHPMDQQFRAWAAAMKAGRPVPTPAEWGREVVAVMEAAELSAARGREVLVDELRKGR